MTLAALDRFVEQLFEIMKRFTTALSQAGIDYRLIGRLWERSYRKISRSIVQAHHGQIWAENGAGRGAIFHCMLPVVRQGAVASAK